VLQLCLTDLLDLTIVFSLGKTGRVEEANRSQGTVNDE
jgi:hypothetical protein